MGSQSRTDTKQYSAPIVDITHSRKKKMSVCCYCDLVYEDLQIELSTHSLFSSIFRKYSSACSNEASTTNHVQIYGGFVAFPFVQRPEFCHASFYRQECNAYVESIG